MSKSEYKYIEIGGRLRAAREYLEPSLNQKEFAKLNGFGATQFTNWESGHRRISVDAATKLEDRYGLTLDFIYLGRLRTLPHNIASALSESPLLNLVSKDSDTSAS